jgi:AraC family transcriptional regulator of adaptative response/methylated-DNA-[protein]-cysteine methyltransferase
MAQYHYEMGCTTLGAVLVIFDNDHILHIAMDDDLDALHQQVKQLYVDAKHGILEPEQQKMFQALLNFVDTPTANLNVPIRIQGTPFQQQVWAALQSIPFGKTRTYSDIARIIGKPKAIRAVASACAANSLALIIPCHRVIAKNGDMAGYRWGVQRKRVLLEREQSALLEQEQVSLVA